jgi:hypothetical protein
MTACYVVAKGSLYERGLLARGGEHQRTKKGCEQRAARWHKGRGERRLPARGGEQRKREISVLEEGGKLQYPRGEGGYLTRFCGRLYAVRFSINRGGWESRVERAHPTFL